MAEAIPATKPTTPMTSAIAWWRVTVSRIGFGPRGPAGNHQDPVRTVHLCGGKPGVRQRGLIRRALQRRVTPLAWLSSPPEQKQQRTTMTRDLGVWTALDCASVLIDDQEEMFEALPSIPSELDGIEPIDRSSMNTFEDQAFRLAASAHGGH
jgi:hypothetical protein